MIRGGKRKWEKEQSGYAVYYLLQRLVWQDVDRNRRQKARTHSVLENIQGIGPKRRQALLKHLGGIREVMNASIEVLKKVPGISEEMAQDIYENIHSL